MYRVCIAIEYVLSRKHLSVPPGLGQQHQLVSFTLSVFFSAARSQVLHSFLKFTVFFSAARYHVFPPLSAPGANCVPGANTHLRQLLFRRFCRI